MKKAIFNILTASAILATIGFLMDGDAKEPSMFLRFAEFFGMVGLLFGLIATVYFPSRFVYANIRKR
ncbi:hypothetical protein [Flavobacterium selenitireducens]|uniref:hypothetical protein n=1 Tax=Flavobacterium selenitireducens TaxID=2722704 RepID=UPI00168A9274|nr:hypothetical protein [Flavobacterium selenitireducens]MBD3581866.1 hypothetical protein [Flavobacterium selenitireducens]